MSHRIKVSKRAAEQIRTATRWWIENRAKAPDALDEEIDRAFGLIRVLPAAGQPVDHPTISDLRRLHLPRVHYFLYYAASEADRAVEVLALWHVRRGQPPAL